MAGGQPFDTPVGSPGVMSGIVGRLTVIASPYIPDDVVIVSMKHRQQMNGSYILESVALDELAMELLLHKGLDRTIAQEIMLGMEKRLKTNQVQKIQKTGDT